MTAQQLRAGCLAAIAPPTLLIHHFRHLEIKARRFACASPDTRHVHRIELLIAAGLPTVQSVRAKKSRAALYRLTRVRSKAPEK